MQNITILLLLLCSSLYAQEHKLDRLKPWYKNLFHLPGLKN